MRDRQGRRQEWTDKSDGRTFEIDTICPRCKTPLRLIAMIETYDTIKKVLSAMGLPTCAPKLWPARLPRNLVVIAEAG